MKTLFLLLGLAGSMLASPVLYNFSFTGGSPNPTGSFDYDTSTNLFSNVNITWNGLTIPDLTSSFNESVPNFCGGVAAPLAVFQMLTQGTCGGGQWSASNSYAFTIETNQFEFVSLDFTFNGLSGINSTGNAELSSAPYFNTSGTVSATVAAAPEPGSLALCLAGGALLMWRRRRQN